MFLYASLIFWVAGIALVLTKRSNARTSYVGFFTCAGLLIGAILTILLGPLGLASLFGSLGLLGGALVDRMGGKAA